MKRQHCMPFGAECLPDGKVRFRLWAPAAQQVSIIIDERAPIPLQPVGEGWYEHVSAQAHAGSRYRYQISNRFGADGLCVPDPASRYNPGDVHGFSEVIDPTAF